MAGIYIVEVTTGDRVMRVVVVAVSATDAAEPYEAPGSTIEVGRLGTFEPGFEGARMVAAGGDEVIRGSFRR